MSYTNTFNTAIKAIWINKVRSFLTMLGVIIGVGSVVLLTSIGTGLQAYISDQFASLGTNTFFVVPGNPFGEEGGFGGEESFLESTRPTLKMRYMDKILRDHRDLIKEGSAMGIGRGEAKYRQTTKQVTILGATESYQRVMNTQAETGHWFDEQDNDRSQEVALLGPEIAKELFGQIDPVGKKIKIGSQSYKILGVLEEKGAGVGGGNYDNYIYVPINTLFDNFDSGYIDNFMFQTYNEEDVTLARKKVEMTLLKYLDEDEFTVVDQAKLLETIQSILGVMTAALGGIAAISLVVGGIGIMNIMLVSVTERTREIGLRKALGATPNQILLQFLIEAALLSILGGLIGLVIAYLGSLAIQNYFPAKVTINAIIMAFGVSTAVGLIFGAAPARRASKLSPIEALRYE